MSHSVAIKCTCCGAGLPASRVNDIVECEYCGIKSRITETGKSEKILGYNDNNHDFFDSFWALKDEKRAKRREYREQKRNMKTVVKLGAAAGAIGAVVIAAHLIRKSTKK